MLEWRPPLEARGRRPCLCCVLHEARSPWGRCLLTVDMGHGSCVGWARRRRATGREKQTDRVLVFTVIPIINSTLFRAILKYSYEKLNSKVHRTRCAPIVPAWSSLVRPWGPRHHRAGLAGTMSDMRREALPSRRWRAALAGGRGCDGTRAPARYACVHVAGLTSGSASPPRRIALGFLLRR